MYPLDMDGGSRTRRDGTTLIRPSKQLALIVPYVGNRRRHTKREESRRVVGHRSSQKLVLFGQEESARSRPQTVPGDPCRGQRITRRG